MPAERDMAKDGEETPTGSRAVSRVLRDNLLFLDGVPMDTCDRPPEGDGHGAWW